MNVTAILIWRGRSDKRGEVIWHTEIPTDGKTKLVECYSTFQNRYFYQVAYYNGGWNTRNCKVVRWMDLPPEDEIVDQLLKTEPDPTVDEVDYIERARAVRIVRGLE